MFDLFDNLPHYMNNAALALKIFAGLVLAIMALVVVYVITQLCKPTVTALRWLFPVDGTSEIAQGLSHGLRLSVYSAAALGAVWALLIYLS